MKPWVSNAVAVAIAASCWTGACNARQCAHSRARNCLNLPATLNFSSVPDVSNPVVDGAPSIREPQKPAADQSTSEPYSGPMIGVDKNVRAPTVGYYWSIH